MKSTQLGPFRLLRRLGHGGMAEVHLAVAYGASGFEKKFALKTLLPELVGRSDLERLLIDEARLGARLQHRNLVQVHDLGVTDGRYWVRMDYIDGCDLGTLAARALPTLEIALFIAEEVALALDYIHGLCDDAGRPLGLVHRDVSPSNVLLSRAGEVKLADLGMAKATMLASMTLANVRKGKYAYMSPEQVAGDPLQPQSDQFGLGVTLYELLTGRRPFDADTPLATMDRIREAAPPDFGAVPTEVADIIARCLARDPAARHPDAAALARTVAAARRTLPTVTAADLGAWVRGNIAG